MKKASSLVLVFCLLATMVFSGCSKKSVTSSTVSETGKSQSAASTTAESSQASEVKQIKDLNGYEFVIAVAAYDTPQEIKLGVSDYIDTIYQRNKKIEKEYNCKITYDYYEPTTIFKTAQAAILSGDKFADVIESQLFNFGSLYTNSLLYNLGKLPNLNLKSDCWIPEYTSETTFKDGTYGIAGKGLTPSSQVCGVAVHYNKTLLSKLNLQDPATLVEKGQWTWDKFREMMVAAKKDNNNDGAWSAADRWGCSSASYDGLVPFFFSSGAKAIIKNSAGKILYNLDNTTSAAALLKFDKLFTSSDGCFFANNHDFASQKAQYVSGKCLFYLSGADDKLDDMQDEDAVVPCPKYNSSSKYISAVGHNAYILSVPKTIKDPDKTGTILQALGQESVSEFNSYVDSGLGSYFRSDSSLKMIKNYIAPSVYVDQMMFSKNNAIQIYNATECAIGNPIWDNACKASDMVGGFGKPAQEVLDDMFNKR